MTGLPLLDLARASAQELAAALADAGAMLLEHPSVPAERGDAVLAAAAAFFALPAAQKQALDIAGSPHFRGYSRMENERDWREQVHFGRETAPAGTAPPFLRLAGPNRWPELPGFRETVLGWLAAVENVGLELLGKLAAAAGARRRAFVPEHPYLLLKAIRYHAQPQGAHGLRPGVAAHVDFSLVTLTLQDGTGGLEVRRRDGRWCAVPPHRGTLLAVAGELLELASACMFAATPHRVLNRSAHRARLSLPVFVNPSLHDVVAPCIAGRGPRAAAADAGGHVHRVLARGARAPVPFGEAEWRRKGENVWCSACVGPRAGVTSSAAPPRG